MKRLYFDDALLEDTDGKFLIGQDLILIDEITLGKISQGPMHLSFLLIGLCRQGEATFKMGGQTHHIRQGDLIISLGEQIFEDEYISPDFKITVVLMSQHFAQDCVVGLNYMWPYLLYVLKNPVLTMNEEEQAWVWDCYNLMRRRAHKNPGRYLREAVISLTRAFYFEICNLLDARVKPDRTEFKSRSYDIFDKFIQLVSQNSKRERGVEWYANELCISPKYLSEVTKSVSGRTASQWITTLVIIEIKALLQDSSLTVKQVAQQTNFPNQSAFGKYFKNVEGISPSDFRKELSGRA